MTRSYVLWLLALACAPIPAPPPALRPAAPPPPPAPPPRRAPVVALSGVALPPGFALDGDVAEWSTLGSAKGASPAVAVALTPEGATIAARLGESSREGIRFWVGFDAPELPALGTVLPDGDVQPLACEGDQAADCRAARRRYAEFTAEHQARFVQSFQLDARGIQTVDAKGTRRLIAGARLSQRTTDAGITLEAFLPGSALPRVAEAPVDHVRLASGDAPDRWERIELTEPIGFEPWADLRARAFGLASVRLSYQPGEGLPVETVRNATPTSVEVERGELYTRQTTFAALEIGKSFTGGTSLALLEGDKVRDLFSIQGTVHAFFPRGRDLHVLSSFTGTTGDVTGTFEYIQFFATAIHPDGTHEDVVIAPFDGNLDWVQAEAFHAPTYESFGIRGNVRTSVTNEGFYVLGGHEVTWRFDARQGRYQVRSRDLPIFPARRP